MSLSYKIVISFTLANVGIVEHLIVGSVKSWFAFVAVDALSVVTAVLADATAFVQSVHIKRFAKMVNFWIVLALVRVSKAITSCITQKGKMAQ